MSADSSEEDDRLVLVCHSCSLSTSQALNTKRRTICPHCGHLYSPVHQAKCFDNNPRNSVASRIQNTHHDTAEVNAPNISHNGFNSINGSSNERGRTDNRNFANKNSKRLPQIDRQPITKASGPFQSISNFFRRLGPNESKKRQKGKAMLSPNLRLNVNNNSNNNLFNSSSQLHLPPISPNADPFSTSPRLRLAKSNGDVSKEGDEALESTKSTTLSEVLLSKSGRELEIEIKKVVEKEDWALLKAYYTSLFGNSTELVKAVKLDETLGKETKSYNTIDYEKVQKVYNTLTDMPVETQKDALKAIMHNLLKDQRIQTKDELKSYAIFLLNPQFSAPSSYILFAHVLRQVSVLKDSQHHYIVNCLQRVSKKVFKEVVEKIQKFLTYRLYPPEGHSLPPLHKTVWWIPAATKVIALLNASSNLSSPPILPYQQFYNHSLDSLDLLAEYINWQNNHNKFTFCQYPFILSLSAKRSILQKDSEHQMVLMARKSLVSRVKQRQVPEIGELFLNLTVRRRHLVSDSMTQISERQCELKKKLKVTFVGEPGLDMGGLTKEWFMLITRHILLPDFGLFKYISETQVYWFSTDACDNLQEFNLVGVLMGLAVYNGVILDLRFPAIVYKKLLSPAVVPCDFGKTVVGEIKPSITHLKQLHVDMANGFEELLKYDGNVEEDFGVTFEITYQRLDSLVTYDLIPNGKNTTVTNHNREEYVRLYTDFLLNQNIHKQFQAFYHGFHSVCASNALILLRPEEIEILVCGKSKFDVSELKAIAVYEGYEATSDTITYFWEVVREMTRPHQRLLLSFVTGNDRVPGGGMKDMVFKVARVANVKMLPVSHTCFNQLNLPDYRSKKILKEKVLVAIQNGQGFGLE